MNFLEFDLKEGNKYLLIFDVEDRMGNSVDFNVSLFSDNEYIEPSEIFPKESLL